MKERNIRLNVSDVSDFVRAAMACDFDIDVNYDRLVIDAKSILGILGMDLNRVLKVKCYGENPEFDSFLQKYEVA